jgi:osmoprotectant transport system substrate-binding protein
MRHARYAAGGLAAVALLAACSSSKGNPLTSTPATGAKSSTVTIGSANFPENALLAEIYAEALEAKGVTVKRQFNIGSREILYKQISAGTITLVPEYNGALLAYLDKSATAITTDTVDTALTAKLPPALEILNPASAEDKDSLTVTAATAAQYNLKTIADLAPVAKNLLIGSAPEFKTRQQGLLGLTSEYGLTFKDFKSLDNSGPLTIAALKNNDVQVADIYTTDASVAANNFVVLTDPKSLFGAQNVTPLAYKAGLSQTDADALNAVSAKLDTTTLAGLVKQVVGDKQDINVVAKQWLTTAGLGK